MNKSEKVTVIDPAKGKRRITERHLRNLPFEQRHCAHLLMEIDPDTQLVTCQKCKRVMSAYSALMVIAEAQEGGCFE